MELNVGFRFAQNFVDVEKDTCPIIMFSEMQHIFSMYQRLAMAVREKSEDTKEVIRSQK
jgi:hypothetical protein